jgi:hypothetical protein
VENSNELAAALQQFTGTENYYKHWLGKLQYTDGVKYFAETAGGGAYWFLDIVATEILPLQAKEPFISIELLVDSDAANLQVTDGNDNQIFAKAISYTDCPTGSWNFYLIDNILLLRSEY